VDAEARSSLEHLGWRILTVWECALKGSRKIPLEGVLDEAAEWLIKGSNNREIKGRKSKTKRKR
jgi:DNA mismatch endonuclease (patch repair protein)